MNDEARIMLVLVILIERTSQIRHRTDFAVAKVRSRKSVRCHIV